MALKIRKASDFIEAKNIKALIYGPPGTGKTVLSMTAPSPLLIDCDNGLRRVEPRFRSDNMEVESWADIQNIINNPDDIKQFETLIFDTAGRLLDFLSMKIVSENSKMGSKTGGLSLQGYGALLGEFRAFNAKIMALGKNVIYIAHDTEKNDGDSVRIRPDITGKSMGSILREMDLVGYILSRNGEREISFTPTEVFYGKNSCNLPKIISIPNLNTKKEKPMTTIFSAFKEMVDSQGALMEEYSALLAVIDLKVESVVGVETATSISEELKGLQEIWDSKLIARMKLNDRLAEIGCKYNSTEKVFEMIKPVEPPKEEKKPEIDKPDGKEHKGKSK